MAGNLNQLVKFSAGRERPFVHVLPADQKSLTSSPDDNNTSFYSGHTSFAFALTFSSGTIASMRGYKMAPWIWGVGLTVSTATAYFRIAADKHYFTDVLGAAVIGSSMGFAIPYFFHSPVEGDEKKKAVHLSLAPIDGGGLILGSLRL